MPKQIKQSSKSMSSVVIDPRDGVSDAEASAAGAILAQRKAAA